MIMKNQELFYKNLVLVLLVLLRLLSPLLLLFSPQAALLFSFFLDAIDGDLLETFVGFKRITYQKYDKLLDSWWLFFVMIYLLQIDVSHLGWFLFLFLYRMLGVLIMMIRNEEWLLFVFPNVFESVFAIYLFFPGWIEWRIYDIFPPIPIVVILTIIGLIREYWLHVIHRDIFDLKKFLGR